MMAQNLSYIWINGEFLKEDEPAVTISNRSFAYGDGFFETIHAYGTEAKHFHLHYNRMAKSIAMLEMSPPSYFNMEMLTKQITKLLNKNRHFGSARVRITIFREQGGLYIPTNNNVGIAIHSAPLPNDYYQYNTKGLVVDIYSDIRKPINILSPLKSCNSLLYVMAGIYKQKHGLDDCIIINDQNRIAEAISSNIFLVFGNTIRTPSINEGCVAGIMRQIIIDLAPKVGFKVLANETIEPNILPKADEVFLTNALSGIRWVVGLRQKRYFGSASRKLSKELNQQTFGI